jgi:hypothetical protein
MKQHFYADPDGTGRGILDIASAAWQKLSLPRENCA